MQSASAAVERQFRHILGGLPPGLASWVGHAAGWLRKLGPYAAIELLLPGGTLVVVLLWLYRRYRTAAVGRAPVTTHEASPLSCASS